jgi:hypothetical protein
MKKQIIATCIVLLITSSAVVGSPASATSCKDADNAISNAQSAYMGAMAAVSTARAALSSAQSRERMAKLPGQRVAAAVEATRAQSALSSASNALSAARAFLSSQKSMRQGCTK